jgi:divalent metal cation (Fe/Co/Zn/Cd) transporter
VFWLQGITLTWMVMEAALSLYAARAARSPVLLAFGSDSLVELLSASVVLMAFLPRFSLSKERAAHLAGVLLFVLAGVVSVTAVFSLVRGGEPQASRLGMGVTIAALIIMPILAGWKRRVAHSLNSRALAADAVQSATCAYLAALTLGGLVLNAVFHLRWVDSTAALFALPILCIEGRRALRGESCGCC